MAKETIYPFAVAKIRVFEKRLLRKQQLLTMAEAKDADEAMRILMDAGYGSGLQAAAHDFEKLLSEEQRQMYSTIKELVPEENFINIFLYKNDYHNLKVLIKEELSGADGSKYLIDGGTIPLEKLKKSLADRTYSGFTKNMEIGVKNAYDLYSKQRNGQIIDICLDVACFKDMKETAEGSKNSFIQGYVTILCDLANLKNIIRVRKMKKSFANTFTAVFVPGGKISLETFRAAFSLDAIAAGFKSTDYGELCEKGMPHGFTEFEKLCDNYVMEYVSKAKYEALTIEPLIAYVYAKETEIKTVRIIMASKLNGIDTDTIKERLRDAYV